MRLQHLRWSQASTYRLISEGMGTFWREETTHTHGTRGHRGISPVWGMERLPRHKVEVPWELCTGDVATWNSLAYHAWVPELRPPRITRSGVVRKPLPNHPYSRAKTGRTRASRMDVLDQERST